MPAADDRRALGSSAVVRPSTAASWLPFGDAAALRWLRARGLIRSVHVPADDGEIRIDPRSAKSGEAAP